jgi:hypothetical protein
MKVRIRQFEFDTDVMASYPTGVATMPAVFISDTGATFLQVTRAKWELPRARHISRAEALRLAECYGIRELKERLTGRGNKKATEQSGTCLN